MGKVLFMRKGEIHTAPTAGLPVGYTKLEYIQSSGTQCINTEHVPASENLRIVFDFEYTAAHSDRTLFGSQASAASLLVYANPMLYVGTTSNVCSFTSSLNTRYLMDCHAVSGAVTATFDGIAKTGTYAGSMDKTLPLFLLANNYKGRAAEFTSAKLYSCQIYDDGALVRDFIPCINDSGDVGLYDLVGKKFYGNAGSGTFIGSEVA